MTTAQAKKLKIGDPIKINNATFTFLNLFDDGKQVLVQDTLNKFTFNFTLDRVEKVNKNLDKQIRLNNIKEIAKNIKLEDQIINLSAEMDKYIVELSIYHPNELSDFGLVIRQIQRLVAARIAMRARPDIFEIKN